MHVRRAFMLFGPTASGKTSLGIALAKAYNGVIINADSRQIYTDIPIISAMPTPEEFAVVPHALYNFLAPGKRYSVGDYICDAVEEAEKVWKKGQAPIFVGGTGMYLRMLQEGISPIPDVPSQVEKEVYKGIEADGVGTAHAKLALIDSKTAQKLPQTDTQRIARALGVYEATKKPLSWWQSQPKQGGLQGVAFTRIALCPKREILHQRIEKRLENMITDGVEAEIRALYNAGHPCTLPALTGLGIAEHYAYFDGQKTLQEAQQATLYSLRQYAKRQCTWLKNSYGAHITLEEANPQKTLPIIAKYVKS